MEVLEKGDILLFLEAGENWIKVKSFNTGKTGYIIFEVDEENLKFKDQEHLNEIGIHGVFHGLYT